MNKYFDKTKLNRYVDTDSIYRFVLLPRGRGSVQHFQNVNIKSLVNEYYGKGVENNK